MKNRTILGIICIILAIAVSFGVAPLVNNMASSKTNIVRVVKDIPQGKQITADDVTNITVGGYNLPAAIIKDEKTVIGKYAACDLKANDYLLPSKLNETANSADDVFKTLNGSEQAMSITISSFAAGLSGKLKNGDIVSIIVVNKDSGATASIPAQLKYVRVITTTTASGSDANKQVQNSDKSNNLPSTITLLVNEEQSKLLAEYEVNATIQISLVYRGDEATANKFLSVQQAVFAKSEVNSK
jgi:pilus assembly protein CpaB